MATAWSTSPLRRWARISLRTVPAGIRLPDSSAPSWNSNSIPCWVDPRTSSSGISGNLTSSRLHPGLRSSEQLVRGDQHRVDVDGDVLETVQHRLDLLTDSPLPLEQLLRGGVVPPPLDLQELAG